MSKINLLIINGKSANDSTLRKAVYQLRDEGFNLQVRVTWESSDIRRFVQEAIDMQAETVIAAGGDGTINSVVSELIHLSPSSLPTLGVIPLGTANDFATSAQIPRDMENALNLAVKGRAVPIDVINVNKTRYFINMASGGFGTKITTETPEALKSALGGAAYFINGLLSIDTLKADHCTIEAENFHWEGESLILGIGNGRQAGGGQQLCPDALINDNKLNITIVEAHELLPSLLNSLFDRKKNDKIIERESRWVNISASHEMVFNLDGEPLLGNKFEFIVLPEAIHCRLPPQCDLLS
ncbi:lipid kinase YegS [Proteus faecis]|uniref:Probable lipid kinase YegS-like n=1 Tax=Proteus faecis TaxID=2050967 RepID=A0AAW7CNF0_9GAMM|nr:lipid kinase YegS [Proteus faecis]MBG3014094.1 lipid kinase YegS [Proteus mirabilis]QNH67003.1 lipid kinase YegS [Proteus vulgaris]MCT8248313.1 lipid kinase YegS [Proteus faecis]MDL5166619.1 lipid kinase YegS [Proteus faecis]MDL5274746.1 lipid kinase YegS [Proteus faecis]